MPGTASSRHAWCRAREAGSPPGRLRPCKRAAGRAAAAKRCRAGPPHRAATAARCPSGPPCRAAWRCAPTRCSTHTLLGGWGAGKGGGHRGQVQPSGLGGPARLLWTPAVARLCRHAQPRARPARQTAHHHFWRPAGASGSAPGAVACSAEVGCRNTSSSTPPAARYRTARLRLPCTSGGGGSFTVPG